MSITKNHQSPETLHALARAAFPDQQVACITELTEGLFNAAYRLDFSDGSASILKVAAAAKDGLLSNEISLMQAEVSAMQIARQHGLPHIARVQHSDFSRTLCSGSFFFMEVLPGSSLSSCQSALSEDAKCRVLRQVGAFQRGLADIHGTSFGLIGDERRFSSLYELNAYLFANVLRDAAARSVSLSIDADALRSMLARDRACFDEVERPSLVHWDMWEGNIFVKDGTLSGVIDWERAMWADPLMDDRFRQHTRHPAFLDGFGQNAFTDAQLRRIHWYDLFLYITMITECTYRQYGDSTGMLSWLRPLLAQAWGALAG